jgi:hypothetical protein
MVHIAKGVVAIPAVSVYEKLWTPTDPARMTGFKHHRAVVPVAFAWKGTLP